jgi:hypothetical protein
MPEANAREAIAVARKALANERSRIHLLHTCGEIDRAQHQRMLRNAQRDYDQAEQALLRFMALE